MDLPRLELTGEGVQLQSARVDSASVANQLNDVETELGEYTEMAVIELKDKVSTAVFDSSSEGRAAAESVLGDLQDTIREFDGPVRPVTISDVRYEDGTILGPNGATFDLSSPRASVVFPRQLLASIRQNPSSPSAADVLAIRQQALTELYGGGDVDQEGRRRVAERLRRIRNELADSLERRGDTVIARLTVRNGSRQPTFLMPMAILRVTQRGRHADIEVRAQDGTVLDPYSLKILTLTSRPLASLSEEDRETVQTAFEREAVFKLAVMDIHKRVWSTLEEEINVAPSTTYKTMLVNVLNGR